MYINKMLLKAVLAAGLLGSASAGAIPFTVTGGSWTLGSGWGAACTGADCDASHTKVNADWTIASTVAGKTFTLTDIGDAFTFTFGSARLAEEDNKFDSTELHNLDVTGILNLSTPTAGSESRIAVVAATSGSLNDAADDLVVTFAPIYVSFGNGGQFSVDLSDPVWNCNTGDKDCSLTVQNGRVQDRSVTNTIRATFTLTQLETVATAEGNGGVIAVPEPGMIAMMGLGLAGLGFSCRKQA